jgi:hypothetical protein
MRACCEIALIKRTISLFSRFLGFSLELKEIPTPFVNGPTSRWGHHFGMLRDRAHEMERGAIKSPYGRILGAALQNVKELLWNSNCSKKKREWSPTGTFIALSIYNHKFLRIFSRNFLSFLKKGWKVFFCLFWS